jgi:hypothetical protein
MIRGILFRQALEKFLKSPVAQNARVQVCLPNGEFYDIKEIRLLENKLIGVRETHRLVLTIEPEKWRMGKVLKKLSLSLLEARNLMKLNFTKDLASCSLPPVACRLTPVARGLTPVACCLKSSAPDARRLPPGARSFYNL